MLQGRPRGSKPQHESSYPPLPRRKWLTHRAQRPCCRGPGPSPKHHWRAAFCNRRRYDQSHLERGHQIFHVLRPNKLGLRGTNLWGAIGAGRMKFRLAGPLSAVRACCAWNHACPGEYWWQDSRATCLSRVTCSYAQHRLNFWCVRPSHTASNFYSTAVLFTAYIWSEALGRDLIKSAGPQNEAKNSTKVLCREVQSNKLEKIPLFLRECMEHENVDD